MEQLVPHQGNLCQVRSLHRQRSWSFTTLLQSGTSNMILHLSTVSCLEAHFKMLVGLPYFTCWTQGGARYSLTRGALGYFEQEA
jgi:hypothetical protein